MRSLERGEVMSKAKTSLFLEVEDGVLSKVDAAAQRVFRGSADSIYKKRHDMLVRIIGNWAKGMEEDGDE